MKKILITGSSGFIGKTLYSQLQKLKSYSLLTTNRLSGEDKTSLFIDLSTKFFVENELTEVDVVIHCAARTPVLNENKNHQVNQLQQINTLSTISLAKQAAKAGVKRFIFISSIKVNGEITQSELPFKPEDSCTPTDAYALSKYQAEIGLQKLAKETDMDVVIIRPPLVYGPGVKGNFLAMMTWAYKGIPLPLGAIQDNRRSLVSIYNLVDLIITCIDHPKASNQIFLVSDSEDISTTSLLNRIAAALSVNSKLIPIPPSLLQLIGRIVGKSSVINRLCGSLHVDISKTKTLLNWKPPYSWVYSMEETTKYFKKHRNKS